MLEPNFTPGMDVESPLRVPFLTGIVVLVSVFLVSYSRRDPLVSRLIPCKIPLVLIDRVSSSMLFLP